MGWDYWEILFKYLSLISDPFKHFILSSLMGLVVSLLTAFALFASFRLVRYVRLKFMGEAVTKLILPITKSDVVWGIIISSILVGFSLAWGLHFILDGLFNMPLDPPLNLQVLG